MNTFLAITPLGFEDLLLQELQEVTPYLLEKNAKPHAHSIEFHPIKGGVEIRAPLILGLQYNFWLKIPVRILLRLSEFKCRDFPTLFQKLEKMDWKPWGDFGELEVEVSCHESRLMHHQRIEETVKKALPKAIQGEKNILSVYVRMQNDICTVSLDTTGEPLYKRGFKTLSTAAPIRENLASGLLRFMIGGQPFSALREVTLYDPMAGSGTFTIEAHQFLQPNSGRRFRFLNWPCTPKLLKSVDLFKSYNLPCFSPFKSYELSDVDGESLLVAQKNCENIKVQNIRFVQSDVFKLNPQGSDKKWVIINPPYNERLKTHFSYPDLFDSVLSWQPEKLGVILPKSDFTKKILNSHPHYSAQTLSFKNGGIDVVFCCLIAN